MSAFRLLASAAILSLISFPAMAQQVISEPGYCAFFYPSANCQNKGPGNPYTDPNWRSDGGSWGTGQLSNSTAGVVRKRAPKHRPQS